MFHVPLLSLGFMPIITKPTRITDHTATLIDHIYTNTPEKLIKSGLCLADISDHLPLNRIMHATKKNYFSKQFELNRENIKCTWKLISKVIRTKKENTQHTIKKLLRDNRIYIDHQSICDQLNSHFINVGNGLADKL
ncbi:unnamed protein product, partial [Porites evermanni]